MLVSRHRLRPTAAAEQLAEGTAASILRQFCLERGSADHYDAHGHGEGPAEGRRPDGLEVVMPIMMWMSALCAFEFSARRIVAKRSACAR
eukprot:2208279-Alexandrium_andersonii.AAC.1